MILLFKVDHGVLLHKLRSLGITGRIGRWIMNFLQMRRQQVLIRYQKSEISILKSGVPQGSVLGPLLFLIFISDMGKDVQASILLYVDDSKVKDCIASEEDVMKLQDNLDQIFKWEELNNMKFNGDKFQVLRYGENKNIKNDTLYFTSNMEGVIEEVDKCRDLGIIMENTAKFDSHIDKVCKQVRQKCGWILRTFYSRNPKFLRHMYNTLVQPHIDFSSQLWAPPEGPAMDRIEQLLRNYTAKIPAVKDLPYWERLKILKMNSEQRRLERYKIIYTWKILQGSVPNCGITATSTEDRLGRRCQVPNLAKNAKKSVQNLREASFQVSGPRLFNSLPKWLRNKTKLTLEEFKEKLDSILTKVADEPRVGGPGGWPSNSLVHKLAWREEEPFRREEAVARREERPARREGGGT